MGSTQNAGESDTRFQETVIGPLSDSALLKLAVIGALLIALGAILGEGVWAAIMPVWGAGLLFVGLSCYGFIWWKRQ